LEKFGRDLTEQAKNGKLDPVMGGMMKSAGGSSIVPPQ